MRKVTDIALGIAVSASFLVAGCCGDPPLWLELDLLVLEEESVEYDLTEWLLSPEEGLDFEASADDTGLIAYAEGDLLMLQVQPGWEGIAEVALVARNDCGDSDEAVLEVQVGEVVGDDDDDDDDDDDTVDPFIDPCGVTFVYHEQGNPDSVAVAGTFNNWSAETHLMEDDGGGDWSLFIDAEELGPGTYPYKFVEISGGSEAWTCDPRAGLIHCEAGYKEPDDFSWAQSCGLGNDSCNSMVVVTDPDMPRLTVESLTTDTEGGTLTADVDFRAGCSGDEAASWSATLDGETIDAWDGDGFTLDLTGLALGRHTVRLDAQDAAGRDAEQVYIPMWVEDNDGWASGLMYYAFMDRVVNGDASLDTSEGASYELASYMGGDFQGLIDSLPYLDDMGVNVIWISNPQDNAEGDWGGDCGSYSAYHGYWPDDPYATEEHFGDAATLHALVEASHARGMRVVMDWVCNHVHQDHPYYQDHPDDWFNEPIMCKVGEDYSNFDLIPETCWFAEYLPDIKFYDAEVLDRMIEDAIWWAKEYDLDGFRVDGAKHVPHSVVWNVTTRIEQEIEHQYAGGTHEFYTVGETFTPDRQLIASYMGDHELDAQFDFPLYYTIRSAFIDDSASLPDLGSSMQASNDAYGGALMGTFLGNHDVSRFTSYAAAGGWADSAESACMVAEPVTDAWWNDRLELAWTYLLTQPGVPLIYYGDEIGMPGYRDPDNRHPLWWYSSALGTGAGSFGLSDFAGGLYNGSMEPIVWHLAALGQARRAHPALSTGNESSWWEDTDTYAYARVNGDDQVLVILHRHWEDTTLNNGLSFAGLDGDATYTDVLTGETFVASGDAISIPVWGNSSRVLVRD